MAHIEGIIKKAKALDIVPLPAVKALIKTQKEDKEHFFDVKPLKATCEKMKPIINSWLVTTGAEWPNSVFLLPEGELKGQVVCFLIEVRTHWVARVGEDQFIIWRSCGGPIL